MYRNSFQYYLELAAGQICAFAMKNCFCTLRNGPTPYSGVLFSFYARLISIVTEPSESPFISAPHCVRFQPLATLEIVEELFPDQGQE